MPPTAASGTVSITTSGTVNEANSPALAVMIGWLRAAESMRSTVKFANIPPGVRSLAELYGVTELLPLV